MSKPPKTFSIVESALVSGVINVLINGVLGWLALPADKTLPLWGLQSLSGDMIAMSFGIAFGTGIGVTPLTRREHRLGKLLPPPLSPSMERVLSEWPRKLFRRSMLIGVIGLVLFAPPIVFALWVLGVDNVDRMTFVQIKAGWAFVEGALVAPPIAVAALLDAQADAKAAPVQRAA